MHDLAILTPVLGRPHRVAPLLESIDRATPNAMVLFLTDPDDRPTHEAIADSGYKFRPEVLAAAVVGNYARKINHAVRTTDHPLLFLGADDLSYQPGWFEGAVAALDSLGRNGVVGTNDLCNARTMRGEHSTHSLVARWYADLGTIDEPDKLLHEGYLHEFVDDEFVQTAKHRGMFAHATGSIVEHLHPMCGKGETDALYEAQPLRMRQGRRLFNRRRHLWTQAAA